MTDLAQVIADDPSRALHALDCANARDSFADFCGLIDIPQAPLKDKNGVEREDGEPDQDIAFTAIKREDAAHFVLLQAALQEVDEGTITRLMVFMPPGGGKSSYVSVCFPPWFMGRRKRRNVILATYGTSLAKKHGRRARSVLRQPVYQEIMGTGLSPETSAADMWSLLNENEFMGVGIRSGVTGNRADLIVIDDPIKGREDAESKKVRDKTWDEYQDSLRTRLKPGGRIVLIQTRWHEDDLAGRILPEDYDGQSGWIDCRDGERWYVISIPAEADRPDDPLSREIGELFWPEWFPPSHWTPFRRDPRTWASLCQQKPRPDEGSFFLRSWFARFRLAELPPSVRFYVTSDYATKLGEGDYTVHLVWGVDINSHVWLVGGWRDQGTSDLWVEGLIDLVVEYRLKGAGPVKCYGEKGVIWNSVLPLLTKRQRERKVPFSVEVLSSQGGDKAERARAFQAMCREGRVHVVDDLFGDEFVEELTGFPNARYDDQVDAAAILGRKLDRLTSLAAPSSRPRFAAGMDTDFG